MLGKVRQFEIFSLGMCVYVLGRDTGWRGGGDPRTDRVAHRATVIGQIVDRCIECR